MGEQEEIWRGSSYDCPPSIAAGRRVILRRLIADLLFPPADPRLLSSKALAAHQAGDAKRARRFAERALALDPALDDMHRLLSGMALPGEDYLALLARMHERLRPRTYVEIGVFNGKSMSLVQPGTVAIGVDPEPRLREPLPANARLVVETSDDFFARHDVRAELGGLPVDLAFIDGMHHFEFALRDFMNLERLSGPQSVILMHDCYPCNEVAARRERASGFWTGDIWRLVVLLKKYRPDLAVHTIAAPPSGLCMVTRLDAGSKFIAGNLERLCAEFMALDYAWLRDDPAGKLNLFPNDWDRVGKLLPGNW
jgi:hypothetical protein